MESKTGLFITRAQPGLHSWHLDGIKQAYEQGITDVLIGIGSANKEFTSENPFTYDERREMIYRCKQELIDIQKVIVWPIPDFGNNEQRLNYIMTQFPPFDYIITGNPRVQQIFEKTGKKIIPIDIRKPIKASMLRNNICLGNYSELEKHLPKDVVEYLKSINAFSRLQSIMKSERITPKLTVDIVFLDNEWNIILVERKNEPLGKALPGWFVDYGEDPINAALRETKEETSANIHIKKLLGVRGKADRDPRGHAVTIAYQGEYIDGDIIAADDAKAIIRVKPEDIDTIDFAFPDHKEIVLEALKKDNQ